MKNAQFGMIGLGVMGRNFLLNVADSGFACSGYDLDDVKVNALNEEGKDFDVHGFSDLQSFVSSLAPPRNIMLLVPAGPIVDSVLSELIPLLSGSDLVIDGGNSHFADTEARQKLMTEKGFEYLGVGVSGGEEGARHGASIMIGGNADVYQRVKPILESVAAKVGGEACAAHVGRGSAGHFVKMVHNGIEYGLMQILAETYDFMRRVLKMDYEEMSSTFAQWNGAELNSFLVEITADILRKRDSETGNALLEMILDKAAQKGTGKWTSQAAMDLGVPIPTIDSAVSMRQISAQKAVREIIADKFDTHDHAAAEPPKVADHAVSLPESDAAKAIRERLAAETPASRQQSDAAAVRSVDPSEKREIRSEEHHDAAVRKDVFKNKERFLELLKQTLFSSFIVTYAQGMSLLQTASVERDYELDLAEIAKIWRGGCIIRARLLEDIRAAFAADPKLPNLILDEHFAGILARNRDFWCHINNEFSVSRVPSLCLSSALSYFDAFRSPRLPANLVQAQRDYFGAHTYQRIDKEGNFHTPDWDAEKDLTSE